LSIPAELHEQFERSNPAFASVLIHLSPQIAALETRRWFSRWLVANGFDARDAESIAAKYSEDWLEAVLNSGDHGYETEPKPFLRIVK
jgi:hypothetical protein